MFVGPHIAAYLINKFVVKLADKNYNTGSVKTQSISSVGGKPTLNNRNLTPTK